MEAIELRLRVQAALRSLKAADSQATAIAWMKEAYLCLEAALPFVETPPPRAHEVFQFPAPVPRDFMLVPKTPAPRPVWFRGETVVYPELPMPARRDVAWTHRDTLRLEAASKFSPKQIQRLGK